MKITAISDDKTKFKDEAGKVHKCTDKVGGFIKVGGEYNIEKTDDNGVVVMVKNAGSAGAKAGGAGGYKKSSGGFKDNSVGMAIGAGVNNAIQLLVAGLIKVEDVPRTVVSLYFLSEKGKKLASEGKITELNDYPLKLNLIKGGKPAQAASSEDFSSSEGAGFSQDDSFSEASQGASGTDDGFGEDFDDDIPF